MGILGFLFDLLTSSDKNKANMFTENDSWYEHSGEDHDLEDGYCLECDDDEEDLMD